MSYSTDIHEITLSSSLDELKLIFDQATSRSTTPQPPLPSYTKPTQQSNRRLSVASTTGSVSEAPTARPNGHSRTASNTLANPPGPGSSQAIRPDSSMSSRGHSIPPVVVKKTRAPAQSRVEPPKPRVSRKSPLNDTSKTAAGKEGAILPPSRVGSISLSTSQPSKTDTSDIDSLTSGMKNINLKLVTKVCNIPSWAPPVMSQPSLVSRVGWL